MPVAGQLQPLALDVQQDFVADGRTAGQGAGAGAHHIADPADIDQHLVLARLGQDSPQAADHATCPSLRNRRAWAWAMATASAWLHRLWAIFPGTAIFLTVLSINYIGDGLRDAFDPRKVLGK